MPKKSEAILVSETAMQAITALGDLAAAGERLHTDLDAKKAIISLVNKYGVSPQRQNWLDAEIPPQVRDDYFNGLNSRGETLLVRRKRRERITTKLRGLAKEMRNDPSTGQIGFTDCNILRALYGRFPPDIRGDIEPGLLMLKHRSDCNKADPGFTPTLAAYLSVVADMVEQGDIIGDRPPVRRKQARTILTTGIHTVSRLIHADATRDWLESDQNHVAHMRAWLGPPVPKDAVCGEEIAKILTALFDLRDNTLTADFVIHTLKD